MKLFSNDETMKNTGSFVYNKIKEKANKTAASQLGSTSRCSWPDFFGTPQMPESMVQEMMEENK